LRCFAARSTDEAIARRLRNYLHFREDGSLVGTAHPGIEVDALTQARVSA